MSRAFTKEQDSVEPVYRAEPELPPGVKNHITRAGAERFQRRRAAIREERASLGESSLDQARRIELDSEARWLDRRISTFVVTDPPEHPQRVGFGTIVTLQGDRGQRKIAIVGVDEADAASGLVSFRSPLALALHGTSVGDLATVRTPAGDEEWEVLAIEPAR